MGRDYAAGSRMFAMHSGEAEGATGARASSPLCINAGWKPALLSRRRRGWNLMGAMGIMGAMRCRGKWAQATKMGRDYAAGSRMYAMHIRYLPAARLRRPVIK